MRSYIRHPANIPLDYKAEKGKATHVQTLQNVSTGGLCFISETVLIIGTRLEVYIPNLKSDFREECLVVWCRKKRDKYEVGVKFLDDQTNFRMRMVEQVCYIESYRKKILAKEGRELTSKEASDEWIKKYAKDFPKV